MLLILLVLLIKLTIWPKTFTTSKIKIYRIGKFTILDCRFTKVFAITPNKGHFNS